MKIYISDLLTCDWRALYRVSSLLRAQMNQLLAHWESSRHETTTSSSSEVVKISQTDS